MDMFNMQTHQQIASLHSNTTPEYYNMKVGAVGMFAALLTSSCAVRHSHSCGSRSCSHCFRLWSRCTCPRFSARPRSARTYLFTQWTCVVLTHSKLTGLRRLQMYLQQSSRSVLRQTIGQSLLHQRACLRVQRQHRQNLRLRRQELLCQVWQTLLLNNSYVESMSQQLESRRVVKLSM